ncbi:hypothetical protein DMENIID0001_090760 [Sergentomyia squamirostris]
MSARGWVYDENTGSQSTIATNQCRHLGEAFRICVVEVAHNFRPHRMPNECCLSTANPKQSAVAVSQLCADSCAGNSRIVSRAQRSVAL